MSTLVETENLPKPDTTGAKKAVKRDCNWMAVGLILYTILVFGVVIADMMIKTVAILFQTSDEAEQSRLLDIILQEAEKYGTSMLIGVILGVLFLGLWFYKKITIKEIFQSRKQMTIKNFAQILCVFMGVQLAFNLVYGLIEEGLNLLGYTSMAGMETATSTSVTISMFLYASIVGPIVEEVVYRGYVIRSVEKHGKMLTLFISAFLFGIMHANLPQNVFAFAVGLVLAYVALEYSIVWSIVLHIVNNCVFGDLLSMVLENYSEETQNVIYNGIFGFFFIMALIILWKQRHNIRQYVSENKTSGKKYLYVFTSVGMIIFIVMELIAAIIGLEAI